MHHFADALKRLGYRITPQRVMILTALEQGEGHLSIDDIRKTIESRYPKVDFSTVYRNLELLKNLGLVTETDLGQGRVQYHLAEKGHHHHLICRQCGTTIEVSEEAFAPVREAMLRDHGFQAELSHFAVFGRCKECQKTNNGGD
jgi:Fur family ferric uptake transcriptional regulator